MLYSRIICLLAFTFFGIFLALSATKIALSVILTYTFFALLLRIRSLDNLNLQLFACLLPILPLVGGSTLLFAALVFLLINFKHINLKYTRWGLPIFLLFSISIAIDVAMYAEIFFSHKNNFVLSDLGSWEAIPNLPEFSKLFFLIRFFCLILFFTFLYGNHQRKQDFIKGLVLGLVLSATITLLQIFFIDRQVFINDNHYWETLKRFPGTFTDPNAFGIFTLLSLPVVIAAGVRNNNKYLLALSGACLFISFFSGSRSLYLGLAVIAISLSFKINRKLFFAGLILMFSFVSLLNIFSYFLPEGYLSFQNALPVSLSRVSESLNVRTSAQAFFSRLVFFKVAGIVWIDNLLSGVGFGSFRSYVTIYTQSLGIDIANWSDNSNNYYLGLLAENGLIGALVFLISVLKLKWKRSEQNVGKDYQVSASQLACVAFLIVLVIGPHLDFDEISILFAYHLANAFELTFYRKGKLKNLDNYVLALLLLCFTFLYARKAPHKERGQYNWEVNANGYNRWVSQVAEGNLSCDANHNAEITIEAAYPRSRFYPSTVKVIFSDGEEKVFVFNHGSRKTDSVLCAEGQSYRNYLLISDKSWVPEKWGLRGDSRELSVKLYEKNLGSKRAVNTEDY